jgi:hypothetical protein
VQIFVTPGFLLGLSRTSCPAISPKILHGRLVLINGHSFCKLHQAS